MKSMMEYFQKRKESLYFLLSLSKKKFDEEAFHCFRVEVKKLTALAKLLQFGNENFDSLSQIKLIKKLFKRAGRVRELQVEMNLLEEYSILQQTPNLKKYLEEEIQKAQKQFFSMRSYLFVYRVKNKIKGFKKESIKAKTQDFQIYLDAQWSEIIGLIQVGISPDNAHLLRKKLKTFQYTKEILGRKDNLINKIRLEELMQALGNWHDRETLLFRAEKEDLLSKCSTSERTHFSLFLDQVKKDSEDLLQEIQLKLSQIQ
jgi:CHAD domain-containing protein